MNGGRIAMRCALCCVVCWISDTNHGTGKFGVIVWLIMKNNKPLHLDLNIS